MAREVNPVDAHRKAEKSKQLKKQKADRKKDAENKEKLDKQKADAARQDRRRQELEAREAALAKGRKIRNPKRSIYYDEKFNPYGNPPPGMPYLEYPTKAELEQIRKREEELDVADDLAIALPSDPAPEWAGLFSEANVESEEEETRQIPVTARSAQASIAALKPAPPGSAVISSAPVLRDFQSELKRFVPTKLRKSAKAEVEAETEDSMPQVEIVEQEEGPNEDMDVDDDTEAAPRASMFTSLPAPKSKQETIPSAPAPLAGMLDYSDGDSEEDQDTSMQEPIQSNPEPEPEPDLDYDEFEKELKGLS